MDTQHTHTQMLSTERSFEPTGSVIVDDGVWDVRELTFADGFADFLWDEMCKLPSLFSDFTVGDRGSLDRLVSDPSTYWLGIWEAGSLVAIGYTTLKTRHDAALHFMAFDKVLEPRVTLFKQIVVRLFEQFPYARLSVEVPVIYHHTIKLAKMMGFQEEGRRRCVYLMRGVWRDQALLGLTRAEAIGHG